MRSEPDCKVYSQLRAGETCLSYDSESTVCSRCPWGLIRQVEPLCEEIMLNTEFIRNLRKRIAV